MAKELASGPLVDETLDDKGDRAIRCRACAAAVTRTEQAIEIGGTSRHQFQNPSGFVFEIGLFARADGCDSDGVPTYEATWFAAHAWAFALCRRCRAHLGWSYWEGGQIRFWGIVLDRVYED